MSLAATNYVLHRKFGNQTRKLIMVTIADFANEAGEAWPSIDTLADRAECSRRNVQDHLRVLQKQGELQIADNQGRHGTNLYRIIFKKSDGQLNPSEGGAAPAPVQMSGGNSAGGGADERRESAPESSGTSYEPSGTIPPQPPVGGEGAGGDAPLIAQVKSLRPKWGTGGHLDQRDQRQFRKNREGWQRYNPGDWLTVAEFMKAKLPEGSAYVQPRALHMALGMPSGLLADAVDWKGRQRPKFEIVKDIPTSDEPPATLEDIAEIFQTQKRMKS